jgi:eukaryotic-like serine/threonine-protein kinase
MPVQSKGALLAGRYRVVGPLGSGGMATVLLCEDERLGRRVAVKRLHAHSPDDVARRFRREAKVGASLNHPNLVSVFDTTTDDEGVLIVMELVEGETLRDAIERGPLPRERALRVLRDVASALDHAHAHGVVHRDVKPANVLLREDGVAKLVDMGIAVAADSTRITRSGTVLGSAPYMSHEQLEGRKAGSAADVYALAVVAYEALTGRKARDGNTPIEIARQVATEQPPELPGAPAPATQALRRGMALDPGERQPSAGALVAELERGFAERESARTVPVRPVAAPSESHPLPRQTHGRATAIAALLAVVALAAGIAVLSLGGGNGDQTASRAPARKQPAKKPAPKPAPKSAPSQPQGDAVASGPQLNDEGFALMRQGRYAEAIPLLERAVKEFPAGSQDTTYAYALYNLGSSLRHAGRAGEAIPILERRLQIPNQTDVVRRELDLARRDAGR